MLVGQREDVFSEETNQETKPYGKTMMVRVLGTDRGEPYGEIIHWNLAKPVPYQSLSELVLRMDGIADFLGFPGNDSLHDQKGDRLGRRDGSLPDEYRRLISTEQRAREGFCREQHLRKAQEIVCVELLGRSHGSLQGRLRGSLTGQKYLYFRSVLELMIIFDKIQSGRNPRNYALEKSVQNKSKG